MSRTRSLSEAPEEALTEELRVSLRTYAPLVRRDGYLHVDALVGTLGWLIRDAALWREAEAEGHTVDFTAERYGLLREAAQALLDIMDGGDEWQLEGAQRRLRAALRGDT